MDEKLLYISTHLNYYSFNSDEARELKREIEHWTVLTNAEQEEYAEKRKLLQRFDSMFDNNPFIEQKMGCFELPDYSCGITAKCVEGYSFSKGFISLHNKGTQQGDKKLVYSSERVVSAFIIEKSKEAKDAINSLSISYKTNLSSKKSEFQHILKEKMNVSGSMIGSPSILSSVLIVAFYIVCFWFVFFKVNLPIALLHIASINQLPYSRICAIVYAVALIVIAVLNYKKDFVSFVKGIYRSVIIAAFMIQDEKQKRLELTIKNDLKVEDWYNQLQKNILSDRNALTDSDVPYLTLASSKLLKTTGIQKKKYTNFKWKPWEEYSAKGEYYNLVPIILLSSVIVVFCFI